ncbi:helix-turn-helix domain-containing protein [Flavobacterium facile]|uniref:helix-turn-helix domain-containing protein n=1 Tax=Flavobacterium facile TaxID=2893174 RepID=UPI002E79772E|nr:helix-turn-helix domain-containing protein [Flavobacterium sp. T-12]
MDKSLILNEIKKHYKFKTDAEFAGFLGVSSQLVSKWKIRNTYDVELIYTKCTQINPEWLLTGKGSMLKSEKTEFIHQKNMIPLYEDVHTIGGTQQIAGTEPVYSSSIQIDAGDWFNGATAAIRHYGDSMTEYESGCTLVIRELIDKNEIIWGRNYVVETNEMRITKKISNYDDNYIMCYSTNTETYPDGVLIHQPIKINKKNIRQLSRVLGSVNKEESTGKVQLLGI